MQDRRRDTAMTSTKGAMSLVARRPPDRTGTRRRRSQAGK